MQINRLLPLCAAALLMAACNNPMRFETKVHEDGSLDRTIVFEKTESFGGDNIFGVGEGKGWTVNYQRLPQDTTKEKPKPEYNVQFQKSFISADAMNAELDDSSDSLFHVHAIFEKQFRWFYTYIRYAETIRPINRFKTVSPEDYFNQEDHEFIDRLPPEGKAISKADSLYLQMLNEKISDHFATMGIFKEQFNILESVMKKNSLDKRWLDTLYKNREFIYNHVDKMEGDPFFAEKMADSLKIPMPKPQSSKDFQTFSKDFKTRLDFMSFARDGKYKSIIEMPWAVTSTNADSLAGSRLIWRPLVTKFIFKEYTMYAECRRLNFWAVAVSIVIVGVTLFVVMRRKTSDGQS